MQIMRRKTQGGRTLSILEKGYFSTGLVVAGIGVETHCLRGEHLVHH